MVCLEEFQLYSSKIYNGFPRTLRMLKRRTDQRHTQNWTHSGYLPFPVATAASSLITVIIICCKNMLRVSHVVPIDLSMVLCRPLNSHWVLCPASIIGAWFAQLSAALLMFGGSNWDFESILQVRKLLQWKEIVKHCQRRNLCEGGVNQTLFRTKCGKCHAAAQNASSCPPFPELQGPPR